MLAADLKMDLSKVRYPCLATPKIDGYRCLVLNGNALTRNFKPQPNLYIRECLRSMFTDFLDGELVIPNSSFNEGGGLLRTITGSPNFEYHVFDDLRDLTLPYKARAGGLINRQPNFPPFVKPILPRVISNEDELREAEEHYILQGYEGVMLRDPLSKYKSGRSTLNEFGLVKLKRFIDDEATCTGFDELQRNHNELEKNAFGLADRSTHQENLVGGNTLGALKALWKNENGLNVEISVGSGFTQLQRDQIWLNRMMYIGKTFTFKYQPHGMDLRPRHPTFKDWRFE